MVDCLVLFLYGILFIMAVYNIMALYNRKKLINAFICFQAAFTLYYIFIPIVIRLFVLSYPEQLEGFARSISHTDSYDLLNAYIYTMLSYFTILAVYYAKLPAAASETCTSLAGVQENCQAGCLERKIYITAVVAGVFTLIIGLASEIYISGCLGGILEAVSMGDRLRAFGSDRTGYIPQNRLFILILMVSSLASTYFFAYALRMRKSLPVKLLLLLSILGSAFYLIFNAGRMGVMLFLLTFLIDFSYRKTRHPFVYICFLLALGVVVLGKLDDLFFYLSYGYLKESSGSIVSIINEFSFPYLNLLNVLKINEIYGLRWGVDFISWAVNIIPTRILETFGLAKVTSQYMFITEYYRSISGSSAGIPTDILTLGIRQFGVAGILPVSAIGGILCKCFDKVIDKVHSEKYVFMTLRISSIMFVAVAYADVDSFVRGRYDMLMVLLFLIYVRKLYDRIMLEQQTAETPAIAVGIAAGDSGAGTG